MPQRGVTAPFQLQCTGTRLRAQLHQTHAYVTSRATQPQHNNMSGHRTCARVTLTKSSQMEGEQSDEELTLLHLLVQRGAASTLLIVKDDDLIWREGAVVVPLPLDVRECLRKWQALGLRQAQHEAACRLALQVGCGGWLQGQAGGNMRGKARKQRAQLVATGAHGAHRRGTR
jgi:hypothetical protein